MAMKSSLTILFENPFRIGLFERIDGDKYEVCKITFGAEPKDYEVYEYKTRNRIREDTVLINYPLYCPKCKQETLIEAKNLKITVIREPDAKTQSR